MTHQTIVVLDFGSQFTQLIARRLRELSVYSEILPFDTPLEDIEQRRPVGIILSGGPTSVREDGAPRCDPAIFSASVPVLGICYGMQLMTDALGGEVAPAPHREFGLATIRIAKSPTRYGIRARPSAPWRYDTVTVDEQIAMRDVAEICGASVADAWQHNPDLRRGVTPPGRYALRIPPGARGRFRAAVGD